MASTDSSTRSGIYPYKPSEIATIIMAILFGTSAVWHLITMVRKKTWFYTSLTAGAFSEFSTSVGFWVFADNGQ